MNPTPTPTPILSLNLLGQPQILLDGEAVDGLKTTKALALFIYLVLTARAHTRHELAGLFWSEDAENKAKNSLRVALSNLNKLLPGFIESDRLNVAFDQEQHHEIDVHIFEKKSRLIAATPDAQLELLQEAMELYRGDFLLDFHVDGAPEFETWQLGEREHYRQLALELLEQLGDRLLQGRRYGEAVDALSRLLVVEPWYERGHRRLMLAYSRIGDFNRALAQYELCSELLEEELGVPPMPETQALYERIRAARQGQPAKLPVDALPFVGREPELAEISKLLLEPSCRLITIVGLGGSGKTRLALRAAQQTNREQAVEFLNGVLFVSLADVESVQQLPQALVNALEITGSGRSQPKDELLGYLQHKEMLLVLDNIEQLTEGVDLLLDILDRAPGIKLLLTSREPLHIEEEWRIDLTGMSYPKTISVADFAQYDAVQLFLQVAQQAQPNFVLTDENRMDVLTLCRAVDGMPLALRLAAPWLRATTMAQIVQEVQANLDIFETRLRNIPARQRSLRMVCEQSWRRLSEAEQRVLAALSVFRGGFTLDAARSVAGATLPLLASLVDHVFLRHTEEERYEMHQLIRQFAAEKLEGSPTEMNECVAAHSRTFADFAQNCYASYLEGNYTQVMAAMNADYDNLRAAWLGLVEQIHQGHSLAANMEILGYFAHPLAWFYRKSVRYADGATLFSLADKSLHTTSIASAVDPLMQKLATTTRARIQIRLAMLIYYTGSYEETEALIQEALPIVRAQGLTSDEALALIELSKSVRRRGDYGKTKELAASSRDLYRKSDDRFGEVLALNAVAVTAADEGDYALAEKIGRQLISYFRELNDTTYLVMVQSNLANTLTRQFKFADAKPLLEEAYQLAKVEGNLFTLMMTGTNLSSVALGLGDDVSAETYAREALSRAREIGNQRWAAVNLNWLSQLYFRKENLALAEQFASDALAITLEIQSDMDILSSLSQLAHVWSYQGRVDEALRILLFIQHHPSTVQVDREHNRQLLQELHAELPTALFDEIKAWSTDKTIDDIVSLVNVHPQR